MYTTFPKWQPLVDGRFANGRECKTSHSLRDLWPFSSTSLSLSFHIFRSSIDGAVPIIPGWVKPGNLTPAMRIKLCKRTQLNRFQTLGMIMNTREVFKSYS